MLQFLNPPPKKLPEVLSSKGKRKSVQEVVILP